MVPVITITTSTPQRTASTPKATSISRNASDVAFQTPSRLSGSLSYRLLYRGALSLPDSYLLLDGLTFSARLESPMKHQLLENPLALALESMRGRQSLRFLGTANLSDVWLDESGNVEMDIHPRAMLSRIYFENIFCLLPYPCASTSKQTVDKASGTRSELGVKIALGDTDGPETTHIIVFGQVLAPNAQVVRLQVARLMSHPPPRSMPNRMPRPDDPTPRRPPIGFNRTNSIGAGKVSRDLKRTASASNGALVPGGVPIIKKQKLATGSTRDLLKSSSNTTSGDQLFKVPSLPGKGKGKEDTFGSLLKEKASFEDDLEKGKSMDETEVERANKNLIKRTALDYLSRTKDPTLQRNVDKTHPEFKEIWGWIYRGVGFALRAHMKITPLSKTHILPLIQAHVRMYVGEPPDVINSAVPS